MKADVYSVIVALMIGLLNPSQPVFNGLLTVKMGWGVCCFVLSGGGGCAGSRPSQGGPDPRPDECLVIRF